MSATQLCALVVDDEVIARKMLTFSLEQEGFSCDTAEDGLQAHQMVGEHDYDLVVTDIRMPNKHGHSLAIDLLEMNPRPVIVIHTSVDDPRLTRDLMARGVDDIMYKPAHYAAFAAKAKSLVARRRANRGIVDDVDTACPVDTESREVPNTFGRYRLIREVGRGAMATVFLARDSRLERDIALKLLRDDIDDVDSSLSRFQQEAKAAATLRHPGICPVFDVGCIDGRNYIAMAYVKGQTLAKYILPDRLQAERQVAAAVRKLAKALAHAHRSGIVHRDLKPSNVIIDGEGQPVITDFGLACRVQHDAARLTQSGELVGTPAYMAPEQAGGDADEIGPATDIYSLGVIFYQLLTGQLPFEGSIAAVIFKIMSETPPPPSEYRPDVDPRLEQLCLSMMAKSPTDRPESMEIVATRVSEYLNATSASVSAIL